jgi:hypothetical protein
MKIIKHKTLGGVYAHHPYRWIVPNSGSITSVTTEDLYKRAFFTDTKTESVLTSTDPIEWTEAGGGGADEISLSFLTDVNVSAASNGQVLKYNNTSSAFENVSLSTNDVAEGTNLYYTSQRASSDAPVQSVDGKTGAVDLSQDYESKKLHNLSATSDPTTTEDSSAGYEALSKWVNTSTGEVWVCLDATAGSAIWALSTLTIDDLGSAATANSSEFTPSSHTTDPNAHPDLVRKDTALVGGAVDDGVNNLQVHGGSRTDTLSAGGVEAAQESIDTAGNVQIRGEGQLKQGSFAIQFNAATNSLDFNFIG